MKVFARATNKEDKKRILLETPEGNFWLNANPVTERLGISDAISLKGTLYYINGEGLRTDKNGRYCQLSATTPENFRSVLEYDQAKGQTNGLHLVHNLTDMILKE